MDEEFNDDQERDSQNMPWRSRRDSVVSLERHSGRSRDPSLRHKPSLVHVLSLEGSEVSEDIYDYYLFEERRKSMIRNSNNSRMGSGNESSMDIEESRGPRRSSQNRSGRHDCKCDGNCLQYHCPCYSEPNEMCLLGNCCLNCIRMKNDMMVQSIPSRVACNCRNGKCLKQLCKCYSSQEGCNPHYCQCESCENPHNRQDRNGREPKKSSKQKLTLGKNSKNSGTTCSCKKSHCLKKYCCCFASGKECGPSCECQECHNQYDEDEDKEEKDYERQRYAKVMEENEDDMDIGEYFEQKNYDEEDMPQSMEFDHPDMKLSYQN